MTSSQTRAKSPISYKKSRQHVTPDEYRATRERPRSPQTAKKGQTGPAEQKS